MCLLLLTGHVPSFAEATWIDSLRHHIAIALVANRVEIEKCLSLITKATLPRWATMATLAASVAISIVMLHNQSQPEALARDSSVDSLTALTVPR
jgi:hypothetical protein